MKNIVAKIASTGNDKVMLCERGASFGYNTLVVDMRGLPIMAEMAPGRVRRDPFGASAGRAGRPRGRPAGIRFRAGTCRRGGRHRRPFHRTHPDPDKAPCDGPSMTPLKQLPALIEKLLEFDWLAKKKAV